MTKDELVSAVQDSLQDTACHNFGKEDIKTVVTHTLGVIKDVVYNGQEVTLRGFGTFQESTARPRAPATSAPARPYRSPPATS